MCDKLPIGCKAEGEFRRYYVCPVCKVVICESCIARPGSDFVVRKTGVHGHPMRYDFKQNLGWRCDLKKEGYPK